MPSRPSATSTSCTSRSSSRTGPCPGSSSSAATTTAQHNAAAARNQLATIVEQSSDFIAAVDAAGKLLFVNEGGRALMALGDRALSDLSPLDFFFPSDHEFVTGAIHSTLLERGRWHGEFRMRHLVTNEPIPVEYNVF